MLTAESRRSDFPTLAQMTYLNTAAEGIVPLCVGDALRQYFADKQLGMDGRDRHFAELRSLQALTAEFFGLTEDEIAVCSCTSEAYNLLASALRLQPGDEVVVNDLDFPSGVTPWLQNWEVSATRVWRSRDGALRCEDLLPLLGPRTRLVTTSLVSFYNGFRLELPEFLDTVRRSSPALVAVDVTQALGRIPLDLRGVDWIVSSTHKWILGPHGGGLVGVPRARMQELTAQAGGWYHLHEPFGAERFERAVSQPGAASFAVGMPNFPAIYATRAALNYIRHVGVAAINAAASPLVEQCLTGLRKLPIQLLTHPEAPRAGILAFQHPNAEQLHRELRQRGIHLMCSAGRLRIAIHGYNTTRDIEQLLEALR
jgi:selenocysteine lyase/cysteine desulfurase